jgi:hypothetical protein
MISWTLSVWYHYLSTLVHFSLGIQAYGFQRLVKTCFDELTGNSEVTNDKDVLGRMVEEWGICIEEQRWKLAGYEEEWGSVVYGVSLLEGCSSLDSLLFAVSDILCIRWVHDLMELCSLASRECKVPRTASSLSGMFSVWKLPPSLSKSQHAMWLVETKFCSLKTGLIVWRRRSRLSRTSTRCSSGRHQNMTRRT